MKKVLVVLFLFTFAFVNSSLTFVNESNTHTLTVHIGNIRNSKGRIQLQIYRNQASFAKEDPWKVKYVYKDDMKNKMLACTIPGLESGVYGIAILDDEDKDSKMKFSWMLPDEGFGFSDYFHVGMSRPKFEDFKFNLNGDKTVKVIIRYL